MKFDFVAWGRTKRYNLAMIIIACVGFLTFIVGLIAAGGAPSYVGATSFDVDISGISLLPNESGEFEFDMYSPSASITVNTYPRNRVTAPVNFTIRQGGRYATIASRARSDTPVLLNLQKIDNAYGFGESVVIDISCGTAPMKTVVARICAPAPETRFNFEDALTENGIPTSVVSATKFNNPATFTYKLTPRLEVWGEPLSLSSDVARVYWSSHCLEFNLSDALGYYTDTFFGVDSSVGHAIVLPIGAAMAGKIYNFEIIARVEFLRGGTYEFSGSYSLKIAQ